MFGKEMSGSPADFQSKRRHWIHSWFFPVFVTSPSQVLDNHLLCGGRLDVWYRRHLHSWDRSGQLMGGGEGVRWQVRSPTPRRHLECLVTNAPGGVTGDSLSLKAAWNQSKTPKCHLRTLITSLIRCLVCLLAWPPWTLIWSEASWIVY